MGGEPDRAITCVYILLCVISVCYSIVTIATNEQSNNTNGDWRDSLPWPFSLLCTSNSIIRSLPSQFKRRCHYRNVKVTTRVYKPCLSLFISFSFSRLSHSLHRLSLSSSLHRLFNTHSLHTRRMKHCIACPSYFIVLTVRTRDVQDHDKT